MDSIKALVCEQAVGVLSSAYPSGWLIGRVGARPVLGIMAVFPLLMCGASWLINEQRQLSRFAVGGEAEPLQPPGAACLQQVVARAPVVLLLSDRKGFATAAITMVSLSTRRTSLW